MRHSGSTSISIRTRAAVMQARRELQAGKLDEAMSMFDGVLKENPNNVRCDALPGRLRTGRTSTVSTMPKRCCGGPLRSRRISQAAWMTARPVADGTQQVCRCNRRLRDGNPARAGQCGGLGGTWQRVRTRQLSGESARAFAKSVTLDANSHGRAVWDTPARLKDDRRPAGRTAGVPGRDHGQAGFRRGLLEHGEPQDLQIRGRGSCCNGEASSA